jgi:putative CocE/NonD family hydrolase
LTTTELTTRKITVLNDLRCPMRDGVELMTDVYMPAEGGPFPTVVSRTPYDRANHMIHSVPSAIALAQSGYAVVSQDVRGRYDSDGDWYPFRSEADDGADTLKWAAAQSWSNGTLGMTGASYFGLTQWQAAQSGDPNLKAIVPRVAYSDVYHNWVYTGGALQLGFCLNWAILMSTRTNRNQPMYMPDERHLNSLYWSLPMIDADEAAGRRVGFWKEWISHPSYDEYWEGMSPIESSYDDASAAAYSMAGWFDIFLQGSLNNFMGMTAGAKTPEARKNQKLLVGPWIHQLGDQGTHSKTGDIDFGPNALIDIQTEQSRWLNAHLKGEDDGILAEPRVKVFVMGANRWRESDEWPIPGTQYTPWYFGSGGNANSMLGDGTIAPENATGDAADTFTYDPMHPVPTIGGSTCCLEEGIPIKMGPQDQRVIEYRQDVLCYTSEPMADPLEVTGPVKAIVYASSSAVDTDFTVKLVDVRPDGYAMNVAQGILRARYRNGAREPELMEPGEVYRLEIDMWSTSICFMPGHRMRVEISSSNFPQYDRNLNTGEENGLGTKMVTAHQTIYHDADHPSHILLPVLG